MISTFVSTSGERVKVVYIALELVVYVEILRPVGWFIAFG